MKSTVQEFIADMTNMSPDFLKIQSRKELEFIQKEITSIIKEIVQICERHNISYFLVEGTLLGAVRHNGFIPWDDDADIAIPISQLHTFVHYCIKELPSHLYIKPSFQKDSSMNEIPDLTRVCNKTIQIVDYSGYIMDLYVDIPVLVGFPNSPLQRKIYYYILQFKKNILRISRPSFIRTEYWKNRTFIRRICIWLVQHINFGKIIPYEKALESFKEWLNKFSFDDCKYVFLYPTSYGLKEVILKGWYGEGTNGIFENYPVRLPKEYEKVLASVYGQYMQIPPKEKRKPCHINKFCVKREDI